MCCSKKLGVRLSATIPLIFLIVGCPGVPPPTGGNGGGESGQTVPATLVLNSDESSRHIARATGTDGTDYDYWVQRDEEGNVMYLSDLRAVQPDGSEVYVQWDALGRLTFYQDPSGATVRVHFYLQNNQADVTLTLPDGRSARGIMDLGDFMGSDGRAKVRRGVSKEELSWELRAQTIRDVGAALCRATDDAREVTCALSTLATIANVVVTIGTCAGSVAVDVVTFPTLVESIVGCAAAPVAGAAAEALITHVICEGLHGALESCEDALSSPLSEDDPPISASETGDVTLGFGDVHVTLTWDNATDVDLHVTDPSGEEIYFGDRTSASGGELDVDDIDGYGPENIFWPEGGAPAGQYTVEVVYYSERGRGPSNYEVTVRYPRPGGQQVIEEYSGTLSSSGDRDTITTFTIGS